MRTNPPSPALVGTCVLVSWLGLVIHNVADLPGQTVASAETALPTLGLLVPAIAWIAGARRFAAWALVVWALAHLVGGAVLSVLPLPILPFHPEQTLRHYSFHLLYGATQIPLLLAARAYAKASRGTARGDGP